MIYHKNPKVHARFIFSLCYKCLGCPKLEELDFEGVKKCANYKKNEVEVKATEFDKYRQQVKRYGS